MTKLNHLAESVFVLDPGVWENNIGPKDWYAVCTDDGIIACFSRESDAYRFRLDYINRLWMKDLN